MRIDEFSAPADIDGSLTTTEQVRFLLFGFDITLDEVITILWSENIYLESNICLSITLESEVCISTELESNISISMLLESTIIEGDNNG